MVGLVLGSLTLPAGAQQLPNAGFEEGWGNCTPWTSSGNSKTQGTQPAPWTISHVIGINGTGATTVGEKAEGYNSASAVLLKNSPNSTLPSQTVPGYITLGTTWSTSVLGKKNDGGSFGGIQFAYKPDAIGFMYQRVRGANPEKTTIAAYSWKGSWSQEKVPADIKMFGNATTCTMVNRDRNVLGMSTDYGGAVTPSADAELISKLVYDMPETGSTTGWTEFYQEIPYLSQSEPTMFNLIIAAGDYFGGSTVVKQGNTLTVDDIKLYYFSRLESVANADTTVAIVDGQANYEINGDYDAAAFSYVKLGQSATVTTDYNEEARVLTVTVSNCDADRDGETSHTYTFTFVKTEIDEPVIITGKPYRGYLNVEMAGAPLTTNQVATVLIDHSDDGTCTFALPDFELEGLGSLGNIIVPDTRYTTDGEGTTTYSGHVPELSLLEGAIIADVKLAGTITADSIADMKIDVLWIDGGLEIPVTFSSTPKDATYLDGYLNVSMGGNSLVANGTKQVMIYPTNPDDNGNETVAFALPNFEIDGLGSMGDIVVEKTLVTSENGVTTYSGHVPELSLLDGAIIADVTLDGTVDEKSVAKMFINVVWEGMEIPVTFTTNSVHSSELKFDDEIEMLEIEIGDQDIFFLLPAIEYGETVSYSSSDESVVKVDAAHHYLIPGGTLGEAIVTATINRGARAATTSTQFKVTVKAGTTGIDSVVVVPVTGEAEMYNLNGVRVNAADAAPGLYLVRRGSKVEKVIVK